MLPTCKYTNFFSDMQEVLRKSNRKDRHAVMSVATARNAPSLPNGQNSVLQTLGFVIKQNARIDFLPARTVKLKMQVFSGGTACAARQTDNLSGLYLLPGLHQILTLMTIERGQSVRVTDNDAIAVSTKGAAARDNTRKGSADIIVGFGLQVHTRVTTASAIGTDDFTSR